MTALFYISVVIISYLLMEVMTWFTHKYVMHGFLWYLHEDHHQPKYQNVFEKNDAFFIIGAIPSITLFYFGIEPTLNYKFFIAIGILGYGITYFLVHDVLIHQRFKWFKHTQNRYLLGLRKAHKIHHKHLGKHHGECFGMLNVPSKYFKEARKQ
jgi:beta-carotene 3-hydroxylase